MPASSTRRRTPTPARLTRAGGLVIAGAAALAVTGRLLGLLELYVLAAAGLGLVVIAYLSVLLRSPNLTVGRTIHPARVHAGTPSRVELTVTNAGRRESPVLSLVDQVSGTGGAQLLVSPVGSGATISAAYRLPTDRRGLVQIGPLTLEQLDPFGLARRVHRLGLDAELTVLPRVVNLLPLPFSLGNDPLAGAEQPNHLGRGGEDFYALRPYVVGDDLRRVHWPSTARTGDLLVRQDEQPWQGRVSVLLDNRRSTNDAATFEEMVTTAASVISASRKRGDLVRLCTASGLDTGFVAGHAQIDAIMEHLAVVDLDSAGSWWTGLSHVTSTGSLVAVVGAIREFDLQALVTARARAGGLTIVQLGADQSAQAMALPTDLGRRGRVRLVQVPFGTAIEVAWNGAMGRSAVRAR